jgi:pimeloyl-ACP methyl ester carboxylesterase
MTHLAFETESGRTLGITGIGEPMSTRVAVLCHAAPGAGSIDPDPVVSSRSGLRIIGIDRPGYGASDRYDGEPDVGQWVDDVADYLARLDPTSERSAGVEIELVGVIGIGYGAFFAAALAASAAVRLPRLVVLQPSAPLYRSDALDDPSLRDPEGVDPLTGLLDRVDVAPDADSYGATADHLVLADAGWAHRVRAARVATDLIGVADDATAWWRRHLHRPKLHELAEGGLPGLSAGWSIALEVLAATDGVVERGAE